MQQLRLGVPDRYSNARNLCSCSNFLTQDLNSTPLRRTQYFHFLGSFNDVSDKCLSRSCKGTFTPASDWRAVPVLCPVTEHLHETFALCFSQGCGPNSPMEVASQGRSLDGCPTRVCADCTLAPEDGNAAEFSSRLLGRLVDSLRHGHYARKCPDVVDVLDWAAPHRGRKPSRRALWQCHRHKAPPATASALSTPLI
jgi:hypothetical protein